MPEPGESIMYDEAKVFLSSRRLPHELQPVVEVGCDWDANYLCVNDVTGGWCIGDSNIFH
jgi:hypothetical protein